jgi:hypothetical protein
MSEQPTTRPAGWAVYVPDANGQFKEVPPGWRYPSEEHARRVAYQRLLQDRVPVQVRFFADEDQLDGDDKSALVEECDPRNAELMETVARDYPLEGETPPPLTGNFPPPAQGGATGTLRDASDGNEMVP